MLVLPVSDRLKGNIRGDMIAFQLIVNTLVTVSVLFPLALGFALFYRINGFIHFSHALVYAAGAYGAYLAFNAPYLPFAASFLGAVLTALCVGASIECFCYRPLRHRRASPLALFLASLGLYVLGQNTISLLFGETARSIRGYHVNPGSDVLGATITHGQTIGIALAFTGATLFWFILGRTRLGTKLRACAQSRDLAAICGINTDTYLLFSALMGSALAGLAAFITVLDSDVNPTMGLSPLIYAIVAAMIGGSSRVGGIAAASFSVAAVRTCSSWILGSRWEQPLLLIVLLGFLLLRAHPLQSRGTIGEIVGN